MNIIDLANCANPDSIFNTGVPACDLAKKKMRAVIFADKGVMFTPADLVSVATYIAALRAKTTAPRGGRVYPVYDITNFEDNTGDPTTGSVGNLTTATIVTSQAVPAFSFGYNGSENRHKRMAAMAGASLDVFFVDDQLAVYGTRSGDNFKGFSILQAYVDTSKFIVSDAVNQYRFRVTLGDITEYRENSSYVLANQSIFAAQGLVNINNVPLAPFTAATVKIQPVADGGTNLQNVYGATLANVALWTAKKADGTPVTITGVTNSNADDSYALALDATAFSALGVGDTLRINQADAAALALAGIRPYEGMEAIITKVAP